MPAYWVARSKINDPVEYKKYTDLVPAIIAKHGGKVLARGGRYQIMEGPDKFHRFVVIEFPTFEQGVACFTSPEYDQAAAFRRSGAGEVETIIVDGGDATAAVNGVMSSRVDAIRKIRSFSSAAIAGGTHGIAGGRHLLAEERGRFRRRSSVGLIAGALHDAGDGRRLQRVLDGGVEPVDDRRGCPGRSEEHPP